ncbi:hypothetical protein B484DRAFT_389849 [Ochromonadaceae sp. CCMP2298]|nr:hypothetical protein B484DRAFT_389849 [Ochromonadaceae sp. CCMP2298]
MSFAKDSASPDASSVASEDVPIQQVIFATQMGLQFEDLLDDDELEWSFEREALMIPVPKGIPKFELGQNLPDWVNMAASLKSGPKYIKEVIDLVLDHEARLNPTEENLLPNLKLYILDSFDEEKTAVADKKTPTTMRSTFSILTKWWNDKLNDFEKDYCTTKSPTFTKPDMGTLHAMPDTPETIFYKTFSSVAICLAGRKCEVVEFKVGDVVRVSDENGAASYHIFFDRSKNTSNRTSDREMAKDKKLFRKISVTKGGKMTMSWQAQNIGKGPCADVSKKIAQLLGYENWAKLCREKTRLGLLPPTGSAPLKPLNDKRRRVRTATTGSAPVYNISLTITGDVSAPLSLFSDGNMPL